MNFFLVGCRDLSLKRRRAQLCLGLFFSRKKLFRAETKLGWLGWQQADFFGTEVQAQIDKIAQLEKEQALLVNVVADISEKRRDLEAKRIAGQREYEESRLAMEQERAPHDARLAECEGRWQLRRDAWRRFENALTELEKTERTLMEQHAQIRSVTPQTTKTQAEEKQILAHRVQLANERRELENERREAMQEIAELEVAQPALRAEVERCAAEEEQARAIFAAADRVLAAEMRARGRETKRSGKQSTAIESKMREPFRLVGACLADHQIAPMNQPEALQEVLSLRTKIAEMLASLVALRAQSAVLPRAQLRQFYALLAVVVLSSAACWRAFR